MLVTACVLCVTASSQYYVSGIACTCTNANFTWFTNNTCNCPLASYVIVNLIQCNLCPSTSTYNAGSCNCISGTATYSSVNNTCTCNSSSYMLVTACVLCVTASTQYYASGTACTCTNSNLTWQTNNTCLCNTISQAI